MWESLQVNTSEVVTFTWLLIQKEAAVSRTIPSQEQYSRKCAQSCPGNSPSPCKHGKIFLGKCQKAYPLTRKIHLISLMSF